MIEYINANICITHYYKKRNQKGYYQVSNFLPIPEHYPDDIKELIQWSRDVRKEDALELYQDLKCIATIDHDVEFREIMTAEKEIYETKQKELNDFNDKWGHVL